MEQTLHGSSWLLRQASLNCLAKAKSSEPSPWCTDDVASVFQKKENKENKQNPSTQVGFPIAKEGSCFAFHLEQF